MQVTVNLDVQGTTDLAQAAYVLLVGFPRGGSKSTDHDVSDDEAELLSQVGQVLDGIFAEFGAAVQHVGQVQQVIVHESCQQMPHFLLWL